MINIKTCLLFLLFICLAASLDKSFERRVAALRNLLESDDDDLQESDPDRRHNEYETHRSRNAINSNRRNFLKNIEDELDEDEDEQNLESRVSSNSQTNSSGYVIILQNYAAMNTRLRVLYSDPQCQAHLIEGDTLMTHQTDSITVPPNARNIQVTVQKDIFANNWRDVHTVSMNSSKLCLRILGVTVSSKIHPCE